MRKAAEALPVLFTDAMTQALEIGKEVAYLRTDGKFSEANGFIEKYESLLKRTVAVLIELGKNVDEMIDVNDELTASILRQPAPTTPIVGV